MATGAAPVALIGGGGGGGAPPQAAVAAIQAGGSKVKDLVMHIVAQRRPWSEITDRTAYTRPANLGEAATRIRKNVSYFKVNYLIFVCSVVVACMLASPVSLMWLALLSGGWAYVFVVRQEPLQIGGRDVTEREKLIGMSTLSFILIFFLTSVGSVLFSAVGLGLTGIAAHGALREPNDLFLDDGENDSGFFNFLKPPAGGAHINGV